MPPSWRLLPQLPRRLRDPGLDDRGDQVPGSLAVELNARLCHMRGTDHVPARCAALSGRVGSPVSCAIYEWRLSPCRESAEGGDACHRAHARHGLPSLDAD